MQLNVASNQVLDLLLFGSKAEPLMRAATTALLSAEQNVKR
jgi:hypothetical protein